MNFSIKLLSAPICQTHLFYCGQAGFIIKNKRGKFLAIDLYLSDCVQRLEKSIKFKRLLPKILNPFEMSFDAVIATHHHLDHYDMDAIPILMSNDDTKMFAAVDCKDMIDHAMLDVKRIKYVKPDESYDYADFHIDFVDCDHGKGAPAAIGVIVTVDNKKIYFTGDTCLRMDFANKIKNVDLLIAPINGAYGNMNEEECAKFNHALGSEYVIPCHYGMFAGHGGNVGKFIDIMDKMYPDDKYIIMSMGECYDFES